MGRDRYRKDYTSRYDEKSQSGHSNSSNPPSRHLWVGNLSHAIVERDLSRYFSQFGELDRIAFQPNRSYAFINFRRDEDAMEAMRELQGFAIGGNPIKIEFAKAVSLARTSICYFLQILSISTYCTSLIEYETIALKTSVRDMMTAFKPLDSLTNPNALITPFNTMLTSTEFPGSKPTRNSLNYMTLITSPEFSESQ